MAKLWCRDGFVEHALLHRVFSWAALMIRVAAHRALIDTILLDHGLQPECLDLVQDVQAWCTSHGVEEPNPHRMAKCFCHWDNGECHIVLSEALTQEMILSGKAAMECYGFHDEVQRLDTPGKFLVHLVLHEVAAHVLETTEQVPRDEWAFERVARYAAWQVDRLRHATSRRRDAYRCSYMPRRSAV